MEALCAAPARVRPLPSLVPPRRAPSRGASVSLRAAPAAQYGRGFGFSFNATVLAGSSMADPDAAPRAMRATEARGALASGSDVDKEMGEKIGKVADGCRIQCFTPGEPVHNDEQPGYVCYCQCCKDGFMGLELDWATNIQCVN